MLGALVAGGYILYKGYTGLKAAVCGISLPSWMGGGGESLFCETKDAQGNPIPSAFNTPATMFDANGNVIAAPKPGDTSAPDVYATDPYTTFGP
jgi:hypothetical protein